VYITVDSSRQSGLLYQKEGHGWIADLRGAAKVEKSTKGGKTRGKKECSREPINGSTRV